MLRQIIKPTCEFYNVYIPKEYINHEVEIMILPFFNLDKSNSARVEKKHFDPKEFYGLTDSPKDAIDEYFLKSSNEW